ncbi:MAG: helix-turn-helix transcriptional regulator [Negativicutes bacterium]|nr:helix-turn-helix transcriptional regulator [Negativicutes bacterium]
MFLGHKLRQLRESKGLTQEQLAEKLKKSRGYIGDLENGRRQYPTTKTVKQFADFFKVDNDYFFTENAYLLQDLTPHLSIEDREFLMKIDASPYITLARDLQEQKLSPEQVRAVMMAIKQVSAQNGDSKGH